MDILINNAGITQPIRIMGIQPQNYDAVLDVNLGHVISLASLYPAHDQPGRGSIASTSSVSALTGGGFLVGRITLRQAGMLGLTKDMARELAPKAFGLMRGPRNGRYRNPRRSDESGDL